MLDPAWLCLATPAFAWQALTLTPSGQPWNSSNPLTSNGQPQSLTFIGQHRASHNPSLIVASPGPATTPHFLLAGLAPAPTPHCRWPALGQPKPLASIGGPWASPSCNPTNTSALSTGPGPARPPHPSLLWTGSWPARPTQIAHFYQQGPASRTPHFYRPDTLLLSALPDGVSLG